MPNATHQPPRAEQRITAIYARLAVDYRVRADGTVINVGAALADLAWLAHAYTHARTAIERAADVLETGQIGAALVALDATGRDHA